MKRLLLGMLAMMMLVMSGCGDDTVVVVVPVVDPPTITSYEFAKNTATEFVNGSVNFVAPDSDIDTITVVVFDSQVNEVSRTITTVLNLPIGATQGTIPFSIDYITFPNDTYTFSIFLTDFNGNPSNQAVDIFLVP
jgi:hypothetical protein